MRYSLALFLIVLTTFIFSCNKQDSTKVESLQIKWTTTPRPARIGRMVLDMQIFKGNGNPIKDAEINIEATMTHPGMVPVLTQATSTGVGSYQAELDMTMAGSWIIFLKVKNTDGEMLEHNFHLQVSP